MASAPIKKISYTHDAMIDLIIAHPEYTHEQIGQHFGYGRTWITTILSSDVFKARLAQRRQEIVNPVLVATMEEQLEGLARSSMRALEQEMAKPNPDPKVAVKALAVTTKALGFGQDQSQTRNAPPTLEVLADNITMIFRERKERIINGEAEEIAEACFRTDASDDGEGDEAEV